MADVKAFEAFARQSRPRFPAGTRNPKFRVVWTLDLPLRDWDPLRKLIFWRELGMHRLMNGKDFPNIKNHFSGKNGCTGHDNLGFRDERKPTAIPGHGAILVRIHPLTVGPALCQALRVQANRTRIQPISS
ncbi:MAG: hypothetical protein J0M04_24335 [Verrucomicrobia bacterium]|nr:hypothetical protein [Verrucomicrobiota bacterium]